MNGTLYEEVCENGLVYGGGHGAAHNFCSYNWQVDCGNRIYDDTPISSPGCLYQYGLYPIDKGCQTTFYKVSFLNVLKPKMWGWLVQPFLLNFSVLLV